MRRQIFVFGSNLAGKHGKGSALAAKRFHGAKHGVGVGLTGNAYAIPTKDHKLRILPLGQIARQFTQYQFDPAMIRDTWFRAITEVAGTGKLALIHRNNQREVKLLAHWKRDMQDWDSPFMGNDWKTIAADIAAGKTSGAWSGGTWELC